MSPGDLVYSDRIGLVLWSQHDGGDQLQQVRPSCLMLVLATSDSWNIYSVYGSTSRSVFVLVADQVGFVRSDGLVPVIGRQAVVG